jgi:hypothetical protein
MTETPEQKAQRILDIQCPSTKAALLRSNDKDEEWRHRPNPANWLAVADAKDMDEAVGWRSFSFQEVELMFQLHRKRGEILSSMQSRPPSRPVPEAKREAAIAAFMSGKTIKDKFWSIMKACGLATDKEVAMARRKDE